MVRPGGADPPPYGQPDRKVSVFFINDFPYMERSILFDFCVLKYPELEQVLHNIVVNHCFHFYEYDVRDISR